MAFQLQQMPQESKFAHALRFPLLEKDSPRQRVGDLLSQCQAWEVREGKLSRTSMIALALFGQSHVTEVFAPLARRLRWLWPDPSLPWPTAGALTARRQSLGSLLMRLLCRRCSPRLATAATKGAFALGYPLMAIDGTLDAVADPPADAWHFGRLTSGPNQSAFPRARCLLPAGNRHPRHHRCGGRTRQSQ